MTNADSPPTIAQAVANYLDTVNLARSANTARTYRNGLRLFLQVLQEHDLDPETAPITTLKEEAVAWFAQALKDFAPATERLYLTAATTFYEYLAAEGLTAVNLPRVRMLIRQRARRPGQRLPQFPREAIEQVLAYAQSLITHPAHDERERLRALRDRAFLLTWPIPACASTRPAACAAGTWIGVRAKPSSSAKATVRMWCASPAAHYRRCRTTSRPAPPWTAPQAAP